MIVKISSKGNFESTIQLLKQWANVNPSPQLKKCGEMYVKALSNNSPKDTGELAAGWDYTVSNTPSGGEVNITNTSHGEWAELIQGLEYGHGTGTGGYVPGTRFVSKSVSAVDGSVSSEIEKVITSAK